jgi:5-methylcytosine-specific restriction enzyme A
MPGRIPTFRPHYLPNLQQRRAMHDKSRSTDEWRRFLNSQVWRRCSKSYLASHPLCARCLADGRYIPAVQVHHLKGQSEEHKFDHETLQALCIPCHSTITLEETKSRGKAKCI